MGCELWGRDTACTPLLIRKCLLFNATWVLRSFSPEFLVTICPSLLICIDLVDALCQEVGDSAFKQIPCLLLLDPLWAS